MTEAEGWLLRDGEVLASLVVPQGWRGHVISSRSLDRDIGGVAVTGPALIVGARVAHLSRQNQLRALAHRTSVHVVAPGRRAVAIDARVAAVLRPGDDLQIRTAS